jgi:drug/metabolite transporter (DMT)-like permease
MASARLCVRSLGKSEPTGSIMLSMAMLSTLGSAGLSFALPGQALVKPPSAAAWGLLAACGVLACGVQSMATMALKLSKATPTAMMNYLGGERAQVALS